MKLNNGKIHSEILSKLNRLNKSQREGSDLIGVSRSTIDRLSRNKEITVKTLLNIVDWLEKDLNEYIIKTKRPVYIEKRLKKSHQ